MAASRTEQRNLPVLTDVVTDEFVDMRGNASPTVVEVALAPKEAETEGYDPYNRPAPAEPDQDADRHTKPIKPGWR